MKTENLYQICAHRKTDQWTLKSWLFKAKFILIVLPWMRHHRNHITEKCISNWYRDQTKTFYFHSPSIKEYTLVLTAATKDQYHKTSTSNVILTVKLLKVGFFFLCHFFSTHVYASLWVLYYPDYLCMQQCTNELHVWTLYVCMHVYMYTGIDT